MADKKKRAVIEERNQAHLLAFLEMWIRDMEDKGCADLADLAIDIQAFLLSR